MKLRQEREKSINFEELCFDGQRQFVSDTNRRILACCSRRAGKSYGIAIKMLKTGFEFPKSRLVYTAMARQQGKEILWPALEELNDAHGLGLNFKQNTGDVVFPNGSIILMRGMGSQREAEKLRGLAIRAACIDEAQGFPAWLMDYAITQVIEPAMIQYGDESWLAVTGTPNAQCAGGFYNAWCNVSSEGKRVDTWSTHHWTFFDNAAIPNPEKVVEDVLADRGWTRETPAFVREYLGQWVKDSDGSAFRIDQDRNVVYSFPRDAAEDWVYVLGVDLGIVDESAFVVYAYSRSLGEAYIVESYEESTDSPSASAAEVLRLKEKYDISEIIADTAGQGKAHVGEWAETYGLAVTPAAKHDKGGRVQMMNADFMGGKLKIVAPYNHQLLNEMSIIQWDLDALDNRRFVWQRGFKDHLCDAAQYGFGGCYHHHTGFRIEKKFDPEQYYRDMEERMEKKQTQRFHAKHRRSWRDIRRRHYKGA